MIFRPPWYPHAHDLDSELAAILAGLPARRADLCEQAQASQPPPAAAARITPYRARRPPPEETEARDLNGFRRGRQYVRGRSSSGKSDVSIDIVFTHIHLIGSASG